MKAALIVGALSSLISGGVGVLTGPKKRPLQPGPVTRDDAALEADRADELARRKGAAADRIVGGSGGVGGIGRLIPGS